MMGVNPADINAPLLRLSQSVGIDVQMMELDRPPFRVNGTRFRTYPLEQAMTGAGAQTVNFQIQVPQLDRAAAFCAVVDAIEFQGPNPATLQMGFGVNPSDFGGHVVANWVASGPVYDLERQTAVNDRQSLGLAPTGRITPLIWEVGNVIGIVGTADGDLLKNFGPSLVDPTPFPLNVALWARMALLVRSVNNAAAGVMRVQFTGTLWTLAMTPVP